MKVGVHSSAIADSRVAVCYIMELEIHSGVFQTVVWNLKFHSGFFTGSCIEVYGNGQLTLASMHVAVLKGSLQVPIL